MPLIDNAIQSLTAMTHTELMLTGIFACLLIQTLFQITGRMTVHAKTHVGEHRSEGCASKMLPAPIRGKTD